jgi:phospholipase/lecithinase/hemolysin
MVAFMAASVLAAAAAATVPAMYVFGDSLADVGNNNYLLTLLKADFSHNGMDYPGGKATGRFSNGKNSADFLGAHC